MYLRRHNKWNEFLLVENSQPAGLLTEITLPVAKGNLYIGKNKKMIRRQLDAGTWIQHPPIPGTQGIKSGEFSSFPEDKKDRIVQLYTKRFQDQLLGVYEEPGEYTGGIIPRDLDDKEKALALTWLARLARQDDRIAGFLLTGYPGSGVGIEFPAVSQDLEMFFHHKEHMETADLNNIKDLDELEDVVLNARDAIRDHQQSKTYEDAEVEGAQEVFRDDDEWKILAIHNKGAACELGKGTGWCTAAPGLDFFGQYYKPEDPLFYFEQRRSRGSGDDTAPGIPGAKFQAHYGSTQFMDKDDRPLSTHWRKKLHNLLMQTEAPEKYPILRKQDRKFKLADQSTSAEELAELANNREAEFLDLTTIAMHPNVSPETLLKLASVSARTKDYVGGGGGDTYPTSLKEQIARNPNTTSEALDVVWEESLKDYNAMRESGLKILTKKKESDDLSEAWLIGALARRDTAIYGHWGQIWQRLVAHENVSNELLNTIIEADFGEDSWDSRDAVKLLKDIVREKRASRRAGEEGIGYVDLRSRLIRRRSSRTSKALPPLAEQRIIQRWSQIIK
tara:strand:- start:1706 stop:3391 length:1686 start_codon:yes stop_codon:yes gene_type:complete